jgi:hypothetical protein
MHSSYGEGLETDRARRGYRASSLPDNIQRHPRDDKIASLSMAVEQLHRIAAARKISS